MGKVHGGEIPGRDMRESVLILSLTRFSPLFFLMDCIRVAIHLRVEEQFENRLLVETISTQEKEEATGRWAKLHSEKLRDLYTASNIIRMFRTKRIRWTIHERDDTHS